MLVFEERRPDCLVQYIMINWLSVLLSSQISFFFFLFFRRSLAVSRSKNKVFVKLKEDNLNYTLIFPTWILKYWRKLSFSKTTCLLWVHRVPRFITWATAHGNSARDTQSRNLRTGPVDWTHTVKEQNLEKTAQHIFTCLHTCVTTTHHHYFLSLSPLCHYYHFLGQSCSQKRARLWPLSWVVSSFKKRVINGIAAYVFFRVYTLSPNLTSVRSLQVVSGVLVSMWHSTLWMTIWFSNFGLPSF